MRDQRDPSKLGEAYLEVRKGKDPVSIDVAVRFGCPDFDADHQGPIAKYGPPGPAEPRWQRIQVA